MKFSHSFFFSKGLKIDLTVYILKLGSEKKTFSAFYYIECIVNKLIYRRKNSYGTKECTIGIILIYISYHAFLQWIKFTFNVIKFGLKSDSVLHIKYRHNFITIISIFIVLSNHQR